MKKKIYFILVLAVAMVLSFSLTQCKKDYTCGITVRCNFTETGIDTGGVVPNATLTIYPRAVAAGRTVHSSIENNKTVTTDETGTYTHRYPYEALLDISATYTDTTTHRNYRGTVQVKLVEGENVEKTVLMMREN